MLEGWTTEQLKVSLPFRILPSRGLSLTRVFAWLIGGAIPAALLIHDLLIVLGWLPPVGSWGDLRWSVTKDGAPSSDLHWFPVILLAVWSVLFLWALFRELSYFWPGNRYYIEIAADDISCISPLRLRKFAWAELSSFERLSPSKERVWWRSPGRWCPQLHIVAKALHQRRFCIRGQDFSAFLGGSRVERVEVLVNFLNVLLRRAQQGSTAHTAVEAPRGLVVAPIDRGVRP